MYTDSVELRRLRLPLVRSFETSFGTTTEREVLLVRVLGEGEEGWGECVADETPYYSAETTTTAWYVLRDYLVPARRRANLWVPLWRSLDKTLAAHRQVGVQTRAGYGPQDAPR